MKFTKLVLLSVFGVVLATIQMSYTNEATVTEEEATRVAEEAYANYQQYYQQYEHQQPHHQAVVKPNPFHAIKNKQDFVSDIEAFMGPDAAILLGLMGSLVGAVSLLGLAVNAMSIDSLSKDQDSICTTAKELGNQAITTTVAGTNPTKAEFLVVVNAINAIATPSC